MSGKNVGAYMRSLAITLGFAACFMVASSPASAGTEWNVGLSGGNDGIDGFHVSVGEYYRVPQREVIVVHDRGICDEDLPVVFYLAQRARVHPDSIVMLRKRGMSWMNITLHFGLSPEIYYVPVPVGYGYPHGHAYGHYRHHPRNEWRRMVLRDRDIVNQVNLRFISEHYRYSPERVMKYRSEGRSFAAINRNVRHERHGRVAYNDRRENGDRRNDRDSGRTWREDRNQGHGQGKPGHREKNPHQNPGRENGRGR